MCIRCTCKRISLRLIITSSMSFVETFLWSRSRHLPRSRDRSRTRQQVDVEKKGNPKRGQRRSGAKRRRAGRCPNGIRIGMGREPCTKQPRRHPAFARIATRASWLAHGKHTVPRERKQILRNRAAHCLGILRHGVDFSFNVDVSNAPPAWRSRGYRVTLDLTTKRIDRISNSCNDHPST